MVVNQPTGELAALDRELAEDVHDRNSQMLRPGLRHRIRRFPTNRIEHAQSGRDEWQSKQKRPRRAVLIRLKSWRDFGAGEGIRTLDPNLGKVVCRLRWGRHTFSPMRLTYIISSI